MEEFNGFVLDDSLSRASKEFIKRASLMTLSLDGIIIKEAKKGCVKVSAEVTEGSKNPYGMIHGGILYTLADSCAGLTGISLGGQVVTLNSSMNFVRSATKGFVHASPELIHRGRSTIVVDVTIIDDEERIVAKGTFSMFQVGTIEEYEGENE